MEETINGIHTDPDATAFMRMCLPFNEADKARVKETTALFVAL